MEALARRRQVLPGFDLTLGMSLAWVSMVVLIPLAALFAKASGLSADQWLSILGDGRVQAALRLSFGGAALAALIAGTAGLLVAWVLVRYDFPGRRLADAAVDLPFALPTAVAGIALATLYAPTGWVGRWLEPLGLKVAYAPAGVVLAMVFIGLPFVVRTVEPVLADLDRDVEEASATLGAEPLFIFRQVILPAVAPAWATGFALAFARSVGEYGSVVFLAGNLPGLSEIAPLLIVTKLEQYDYPGATAIAAIMLMLSFILLLALNGLQAWGRARLGEGRS